MCKFNNPVRTSGTGGAVFSERDFPLGGNRFVSPNFLLKGFYKIDISGGSRHGIFTVAIPEF